jgi:hypothetical protein
MFLLTKKIIFPPLEGMKGDDFLYFFLAQKKVTKKGAA